MGELASTGRIFAREVVRLVVGVAVVVVLLEFVAPAKDTDDWLRDLDADEVLARRLAAHALAHAHDVERAVPALLDALGDPAEDVRVDARAALAVAGRHAPDELTRRLAVEDQPVGTKLAIGEVLRELGALARPALARALEEERGTSRVFFAVLLGEQGADAVPTLVELHGRLDEEGRALAREGLRRAGPAGDAALASLD